MTLIKGVIGIIDTEKVRVFIEHGEDYALQNGCTQKDVDVLNRWVQANRSYQKYLNPSRAKKHYRDVLRLQGINLSRTQVDYDFQNMQSAFGPVLKSSKEYKRALYSTKMEYYASKLEEQGEWGKAATVLHRAGLILALDKEDSFQPDPNDLRLPDVYYQTDTILLERDNDPEVEKMALAYLNKRLAAVAEETGYEILPVKKDEK